ncbi:MAG TPA: alpha-ketoglutarate-dependent dioxygenase AlkB [Polyangiaceae bacterium]|jgi:alkylated DNA repair dioxygenase AlkB|nr:alpha-ketoglutarate-dependent dioxygenase AlkB [Polyangiaceae bacterium]
MSAQLELFGRGEPRFDPTFAGAKRISLEPDAWVEFVPAWLRGHQALFDELVATVRFRAEQRVMYERLVDVPRLYAALEEDGPCPPVIAAMQRVLSLRYGEHFERVNLGYYRDGNDSVAFHGDRVARVLPNALVATVSVGAPRRLLLRPVAGGVSRSFLLGRGDLFVMGGSCQRTWQHGIPKSRTVGAAARIAIMFRPHWEPPARDATSTR